MRNRPHCDTTGREWFRPLPYPLHSCAQNLDKYRINPGNAKDQHFSEIIERALKYGKPVRIGVNGGSLDPVVFDRARQKYSRGKIFQEEQNSKAFVEAMVETSLASVLLAQKLGLSEDYMVLSAKTSRVGEMVFVYRLLALAQKSKVSLHLGLTEAGGGERGIIQSAMALGMLLEQGIGDTIRVSITPRLGEDRTGEVRVAQDILQSLGLRSFRPVVTSCPGCGRTSEDFFQHLAQRVSQAVDQRMTVWKKNTREWSI